MTFRRKGKRGQKSSRSAVDERTSAGAAECAEAGSQDEEGEQKESGPRGALVLESAAFEAYYRCQGICPEAEWHAFLAELKKSLPAAVRVNASSSHSAEPLLVQLRRLREEAPKNSSIAPDVLSWYPGGLAWQWDQLSTNDIKKNAELKPLKQWLGWLLSHGALARQEAVSMIPPLCLDVRPGALVLDLCAAPGSKSSQLLELLHLGGSNGRIDMSRTVRGALVANEISGKRADVLKMQLERLCSPCPVVTQFDAQYFPNLLCKEDGNAMLFDRVLADVPCSGDGTMRKFPEIWGKWSPAGALGLHPMQYAILCRGLAQLRVGGRLVYSTCSFNPVEDEAVVAAALRRYGEDVALVALPHLEGLRGSPGLKTWKVPHPDDASMCWERFEEVPAESLDQHSKLIKASMFPPSTEADKAAWTRASSHCRRFLPHVVGSGGFFVAAFEKLGDKAKLNKVASRRAKAQPPEANDESTCAGDECCKESLPNTEPECDRDVENEEGYEVAPDASSVAQLGVVSPDASEAMIDDKPFNPPARGGSKSHKRAPQAISDYETIAIDDPSWLAAVAFYGFDVALAARLVRSKSCPKNVYFVSDEVLQFLNALASVKPRLLHTGVRALVQMGASKDRKSDTWRIANEGVRILLGHGLERRISVSRRVLSRLLGEAEITRDDLLAAAGAKEVQGLRSLAVGPARAREKLLLPGKAAETLADIKADSVDTTALAEDQLDLLSGSLVVTLMDGNELNKAEAPRIAVSALLSKTSLSSCVPRNEAVAILELLELEERTNAILLAGLCEEKQASR